MKDFPKFHKEQHMISNFNFCLKVVRVDILEDTGASLNPEVDIGQIEGAFMFGLGFWLQEEIKFHPQTGQVLTNDTWEYKPPASMDIPEVFNVTLYEWDKDSGRGVLGSKATGEPAVHMGVSCVLALRRAIDAGRRSLLHKDDKDWYSLCKNNLHDLFSVHINCSWFHILTFF